MYRIGAFDTAADGGITNTSEKIAEKIPAVLSWSTTCTVGSPEVEIGGEKHTLANAPYMENGVTYAPYEYFQLLRIYELERSRPLTKPDQRTSKFTTLLLYGYDSAQAEYYTDYIGIVQLAGSDSYAHEACNARATLAKTGYRTEFEVTYDYLDLNDHSKKGTLSIRLNKVTRIYSRGSDIEGLFTVIADDEVIYENQQGYITSLPTPAGEGVLDFTSTNVMVGELKLNMFFLGFNSIPEAFNEAQREIGKMSTWDDTERLTLIPGEVKLNGHSVVRGSNMYSYLFFNKDKEMIDLDMQFDNYTEQENQMEFYRIHTWPNSAMSVIDANTISAELYITYGTNMRIDSFDAIITLLPDNRFELKASDGAYIVRGTTQEFVPLYQWSEELNQAPVPPVDHGGGIKDI